MTQGQILEELRQIKEMIKEWKKEWERYHYG